MAGQLPGGLVDFMLVAHPGQSFLLSVVHFVLLPKVDDILAAVLEVRNKRARVSERATQNCLSFSTSGIKKENGNEDNSPVASLKTSNLYSALTWGETDPSHGITRTFFFTSITFGFFYPP
jgi:hypothetical protein